MTLEIAILGSIEPRTNGDVLGVPAGKQRALLTLLAVRAPRPVSAESAAEALWPRAAPAEAMRSLQVTVSRLRRSLADGGAALETVASGYRLAVEDDAIDARRFEQLSAEGHRALADGEPERAAGTLREALSLWRGEALAEFAFEAFAQAEIRRLEEERLAALEARVEADLAVGRHGELAGELAQLVAVHPLRERLHGQLMLSLYRCGRQADALQVYRDARDVLVEQLGIEPGPELRALERAILAHDPALDLARPAVRADRRAMAARIPAPPTPTIGREADLARLRGLFVRPAGRLVTVVGSGGVGKTRLALELTRAIGEQFADGAYFVTLAPVTGDEHVASTIARQLDVVLLPSESAEEGLARHLDEREVLLVLDNFEQVLGAAPLVADLLAATTTLSVLVTSREPLRVRAERLFRLDPLALPPADSNGDGADVEQAPAVALFLAVARSRDAGFALSEQNAPAVAEVCRRLDGLPLAIELAAGRIGLLTVAELAARLRDGLQALGTGTRDAPARQRTLAATLQWSYGLLRTDERAALAGLAVFAGGCTLDAAQAVTGASLDVLEALVEKNLIVRRPAANEPSRLTLLETVADFARHRLAERRDGDGVRRRHCDRYLALAERAAPELERSDPPALITELDREVHNLRAALAWALDRHAATTALRLATALGEYWARRDLQREGARWLRAALALPADDVPASLRAAALGACAYCLLNTDTRDDAEAAAHESLELARSIGEVAQCAASTTALAIAALDAHRYEDGYRYATEAERLAREAHDEPKRVNALQIKTLTAPTLGEALALGEQAATALRSAGSGRRLALLQTSLTYSALVHGDDAAAKKLTPDALQAAKTLGDPFVLSFAHGNKGLVALLTGDVAGASEAFTRELELASRHQHELMLYEAINGLAGVAAVRGEDERAAQLLGAAEGTRPERHDPAIARQLDYRCFGPARARLGERQWRAAHAAGAALTSRQAVDIALRAHEVGSPAGG
jgi:predicted ATPase/DNA-binding SARP family transcriptional activator